MMDLDHLIGSGHALMGAFGRKVRGFHFYGCLNIFGAVHFNSLAIPVVHNVQRPVLLTLPSALAR